MPASVPEAEKYAKNQRKWLSSYAADSHFPFLDGKDEGKRLLVPENLRKTVEKVVPLHAEIIIEVVRKV